MKTYRIYPNFCFDVDGENQSEASDKAYELLRRMSNEIVGFDFDFDIEEQQE